MVALRTLPSLAGLASVAVAPVFFTLGSTRGGHQELLPLMGSAFASVAGMQDSPTGGITIVNRSAKGDSAMPDAHRAVIDALVRERLKAGRPAGRSRRGGDQAGGGRLLAGAPRV
jgi:hypothetical protein